MTISIRDKKNILINTINRGGITILYRSYINELNTNWTHIECTAEWKKKKKTKK